MLSLSCVSICPTSSLLQMMCHFSVNLRLEQHSCTMKGDTKQYYGEYEQGYMMWIFWTSGKGKDPHHSAAFQMKPCKITFSKFTWGNPGSIAQINLTFTFQRAGNRNSLQCVHVAVLKAKRPARGFWAHHHLSLGGLMEDSRAGCGTSSPLGAPKCMVSV